VQKSLIVGLGNIGEEYANTRHNVGFKILDALAESSSISFSTDRYASVAKMRFRGRPFILIKPSTYMNLSGKAVQYWMQKEKIDTKHVLVVTDDIALPFGTLRMKPSGSDGGHNGLKNIIEVLGHGQWPRLRFGVGSEFSRGKQVDYVLGEWSDEELKALKERQDMAIRMIKHFGTRGIQETMNLFNGK
jgi:PTH1 family peptidyl-tRNA hydrolase